eukprot:3570786-Prymnesium_polylepis.1
MPRGDASDRTDTLPLWTRASMHARSPRKRHRSRTPSDRTAVSHGETQIFSQWREKDLGKLARVSQ